MMKTIIVIVSILIVSFIGFIGFVSYQLENEKFHQSPCESSADYLIDSLKNQYNISGSSYPKNFFYKGDDYDSTKVKCEILFCKLSADSKIDFQQDSIIKKIAEIFWSFPQNYSVDSLYLTIDNGVKSIQSQLTKSNWKIPITVTEYDTIISDNDFKIIEKIDGTESGGGGDYERYEIATRELIVLSKIDLSDYHSIADFFYKNELVNCKNDNVATLTINIITENPKGQFISEKISEYRFEIIPFTNYYKKNLCNNTYN